MGQIVLCGASWHANAPSNRTPDPVTFRAPNAPRVTQPALSLGRAEARVGRRRERTADQDPRWQVVVACIGRTALSGFRGGYAETVESAEAARSRHSLRRWIRQTPPAARRCQRRAMAPS